MSGIAKIAMKAAMLTAAITGALRFIPVRGAILEQIPKCVDQAVRHRPRVKGKR